MSYNRSDLEALDDDALNRLSSVLLGTGWINFFNPCNNWGDCGQLIDEAGISLINTDDGEYEACNRITPHCGSIIDNTHWSYSKNPKRAVTIVYILIKQGKK